MDYLNKKQIEEIINNKTVFITGGTGSFGKKLVEIILNNFKPSKLIIFSRDEYKQFVMKQKFSPNKFPCLKYVIGDIRDLSQLEYALRDVTIVFHAAALKQVPTLEENPSEAIKTNIYGTENIIKAAINNNIERVIALSTDKSVNPVNLYGASKMCSERLFIAANNLSNKTKFSIIRYGNVFGSRGSVVPLFIKQRKTGTLTITDPKMTRFTLTLENAIYFVLNCSCYMIGGEIFVPKIPSYTITQLANLIGPDCKKQIIGIRPGEKLDECLIGFGESHLALYCKNFYVITPFIDIKKEQSYENAYSFFNPQNVERNSVYSSGDNEFIDDNELKKLIDNLKINIEF